MSKKSAAALQIIAPETAANRHPEPPEHLSAAMKGWWKSVCADYALEEHHQRLLEAACSAWDRMVEARALLNRSGLTFEDDKGMIRAHPAAAIERDSRLAFARLLRELDLDCEPPAPTGRPPALRSNRRGW